VVFGFFRKKPRPAPTRVHPDLGAKLEPAPPFDPPEPSEAGRARKVRIEGVPPDARLVDDPLAQTPHAGFVLPAEEGRPAIGFLNRPEPPAFGVWELEADGARPSRGRTAPQLHPDQDD